MPPAIESEGLTRRFGARIAVDAVSLQVPEGSVYGFLGRNGAGKTTLIKLVLGLLRPDGGQVRVRRLNGRECARLMGVGDDYILPSSESAALKLMGDAVAVPVVRALTEGLLLPSLGRGALKAA